MVVNFVIFSLRATILINLNLNLNLSRRRREMYSGHGRLCVCVCVSVCLSAAAFPQYCADPDVTWGMVGMVWGALQLCTNGRICSRCTGCVSTTTWRRTRNYSECLYSLHDRLFHYPLLADRRNGSEYPTGCVCVCLCVRARG